MGWFSKRRDVIDLSERYKREQEKVAEIQGVENSEPSPFSIFGAVSSGINSVEKSISNTETNSEEGVSIPLSTEEKKKRFAQRLSDMTNKLEELSNQIYHLQQRVEVLEKKSGSSTY